jgi:hypothetical protein
LRTEGFGLKTFVWSNTRNEVLEHIEWLTCFFASFVMRWDLNSNFHPDLIQAASNNVSST